MIGQNNLQNKINNITIDTMPRSVMLVGDYGCGKHTLCNIIADKLKLALVDISDNLNLETIEEICSRTEPYLYTINGSSITTREEGVLLKFLEEPLKNTFVAILCESKYNMLNTIINRCQIWDFEPYSASELQMFGNVNTQIANTPGKMIQWCTQPIDDMLALSTKIFDHIATANFPNTLTLVNKLAFDDEANKYNVRLFFECLRYISYQNVVANKNSNCYTIYKLTSELCSNSHIAHIDNKKLFEHYLYSLRVSCRGGS